VETVGDCYVVSSNLYSPAKDAASRVVRFGLALVEMADGLQSAILEVSTRAAAPGGGGVAGG